MKNLLCLSSSSLVAVVAAVALSAPAAHAHRPAARSVFAPGDLDPFRARIVASALEHLESQRRGRRADCSGLIESVLGAAGVTERGGTRAMFQRARLDGRLKRGAPLPGDLVFFDHTYDRNRNHRVDDPLSHVAVVVAVRADGTLEMVHRASSATTLLRMNLRYPHEHRARGRVVNDFLSAPGYGPRRLAGELFRGFASPPRPRVSDPLYADAPPLPHGGHDGYAGPRAPRYDEPGHGHRHEKHKHNKRKGKKHKHRHGDGRACDCDDVRDVEWIDDPHDHGHRDEHGRGRSYRL